MSIPVKEAGGCSTIFQTISESAYNFAQWIGRSMQSFRSTVANFAQETANYAKHHFSQFKDLVQYDPVTIDGIAGGIAGAIVGGIVALAILRV